MQHETTTIRQQQTPFPQACEMEGGHSFYLPTQLLSLLPQNLKLLCQNLLLGLYHLHPKSPVSHKKLMKYQEYLLRKVLISMQAVNENAGARQLICEL